MVCRHCIATVKRIAESLNLDVENVELGICTINQDRLSEEQYQAFSQALHNDGFEILVERERQLCEQIKNILLELVYSDNGLEEVRSIPVYIQQCMGYSYSMLRKLFIATEGRTIDKYFITLKIERAKELLRYGNLTITEIAYSLGYSSTSHLSAQFKQITGLSPKEFRSNDNVERYSLEKL